MLESAARYGVARAARGRRRRARDRRRRSPRRSRRRRPRSSACSSRTTRPARCSTSRRSSAAAHAAGAAVHLDASIAVGHVPLDVTALGADYTTLCAEGLGAPLGIGALVVRRGLRLVAAARRWRPGARPARGPRERRRGSSGSARQRPCSATDDGARLAAEATAAAALIARLERGDAPTSTACGAIGDAEARRARAPRALLRRRGRRGRARPPRARSLRRQRPLGLGVLLGVPRALRGARRDGRRRGPLAARERRAGRAPTTTSTRSSPRSRRCWASSARCAERLSRSAERT